MSETRFRSNLIEVDIDYGSEKPVGFEYESHSSKTKVEYLVSMDIRDWGIKDISFHANSQEVKFDVELMGSDEEIETYDFTVKLEDISVDTDEVTVGCVIEPQNISIKLNNIVKTGPTSFTAVGEATISF